MFCLTERIDEIGDKIFVGGFSFDGFFFVFDDNFFVVDFDDFVAMDSKFWINEAFNEGALDDDLLNSEIVASESEAGNFAEFGTFFSFDFEADELEIELDDFVDFNDVGSFNKFVGRIYDHAIT